MSINNINNLPNFASNVDGNPSVGGAGDANRQINGGINGSRLNGGVDWFSQLNAGKAHPMKAQNEFGANPSLDDIVNKIAGHLGIQD